MPASTPTGVGTTLRSYYRRLADELGFRQLSVVSTPATGADAARVVIADEWRDDEAGYGLPGRQWLYAAGGDQAEVQRRVLSDRRGDGEDGDGGVGWQGPIGALLVSRPFAAALEEADQVELTSPLPVRPIGSVKGLTDLVNEALARIWVEARVSLTGDGTREIDLAAYPWLTTIDQMRGIYDRRQTSVTAEPYSLSNSRYRLVTNGVTRTLITDVRYADAEAFELAVIVRGDHLVHDGSAWSYTTGGLQHDTWMAAAPIEWVCAIGMAKALQYVERLAASPLVPAGDREIYAATLLGADGRPRKRVWEYAAAKIVLEERPPPLQHPAESMISGPYVTEREDLSGVALPVSTV